MYWKHFTKSGKFVFISLIISSQTIAQIKSTTTAETGSQKGQVIAEDLVDIYKDPDFDSKVIGRAEPGKIYDISKYPKGPFYKIRLKHGLLGWISDAEVKPTTAQIEPQKKNKPIKEKAESKEISKKPFLKMRFRGPSIEIVNWIEDTAAATRTETLNFYGMNWSGYNTMISGDVYTDANLLFALNAPKYYQRVTGNSAGGWIFKMNFLFQTPLPQTKYYLLYYGFGPSFTYSHFDVTLVENSKNQSYALDDMSVGAVFNIGLSFKIGTISPRVSVKYYWEKKQMPAVALSLGWEF